VVLVPEPDADALTFAFARGRMLVRPGLEVPAFGTLGPVPRLAAGPISLGRLDGRPCYAVALEGDLPDGLTAVGLRELFARLEDGPVVSMAARASQTLDWWFGHAFCGRCGGATEAHPTEMARSCPACGAMHFPRISPAVITLVHRGMAEVLLAHDRRFRPGFFALLAGFVEPGETLEQAVAREVREEVGLEVEDIRYFGSQSWPFPSQLMVGFYARYRSGEIRVQEEELTEARWFPVSALPGPEDRPATFSIAGRLIARYWRTPPPEIRDAHCKRSRDSLPPGGGGPGWGADGSRRWPGRGERDGEQAPSHLRLVHRVRHADMTGCHGCFTSHPPHPDPPPPGGEGKCASGVSGGEGERGSPCD
jgi:NAD+ diphosphatase